MPCSEASPLGQTDPHTLIVACPGQRLQLQGRFVPESSSVCKVQLGDKLNRRCLPALSAGRLDKGQSTPQFQSLAGMWPGSPQSWSTTARVDVDRVATGKICNQWFV